MAAAGDLDGNGKPDIIWQNDATRVLLVWYMTGAAGNVYLGANFISSAGVPGWHAIMGGL